ncbi:ORF1 [torque teno Delphinidae virus 50]
MPPYPYYRRRRYRRRGYQLRYGRAVRRWRRYWKRYRRWPRSRRWVRRRRALRRRFRRGYRRRWAIRRRRFRARRRRIPIRLIQWSPRYRVNCYISGYTPTMFFTRTELHRPFLDPVSCCYLGGSISCYYYTLEWLYNEMLMRRNRWSRSNYGFQYGRFRWVKFVFYRNDSWSYVITWAQGEYADESLPWEQLHPSVAIMNKKRVIMRCNNLLPYRKQYKNKKLFFRPPVDMTNQWYKLSDLAHKTLVRICCTLIDLHHIWFWIDDWTSFKGYYQSYGYKTPDRCCLIDFYNDGHTLATDQMPAKRPYHEDGDWITSPNKTKLYSTVWINYRTWGGIYHTLMDPEKRYDICSDNLQTVLTTTTGWSGIYETLPLDENSRTAQKTLGDLERQVKTFCTNPQRRPQDYPYITVNDQCTVTGPPNLSRTPAAGGHSLAETGLRGRIADYSTVFTPTPGKPENATYYKQSFWFGRYNACWDNGYNNKVFGLWIDNTTPNNRSQGWKNFADGYGGPPSGLWDTVESHLVSENEPYYTVFYGHSYKTYLTWLNLKYPHIVQRSWDHRGFIAVCCTMYPGYKVVSGPFPDGFVPMVYQGHNYDYYSREHYDNIGQRYENWPKWWPPGQSHPPLNDKGDIDFDCRIMCLLCDGRWVCYGQGLEGSLLFKDINKPQGNKLWANGHKYKTDDDIDKLGKSGPFVHKNWVQNGDSQDNCPNFYTKYIFKFQWGTDKWPGRYTEIWRPSSFNDPGEYPLPAGFPEENEFIPPGSPSKPRKSHRKQPDPNIYTGGRVRRRRALTDNPPGGPVLNPREASARHYDPQQHLDADGLIKDKVFKRLTSCSLDTIDQRVPLHSRAGTVADRQLWAAYSAGTADCERRSKSCVVSDSSSTPETSPSPPHHRRRRVSVSSSDSETPEVKKPRRRTLSDPYKRHIQQSLPPKLAIRSERRSSMEQRDFNRELILRQLQQLRQLENVKRSSMNFTQAGGGRSPHPHTQL